MQGRSALLGNRSNLISSGLELAAFDGTTRDPTPTRRATRRAMYRIRVFVGRNRLRVSAVMAVLLLLHLRFVIRIRRASNLSFVARDATARRAREGAGGSCSSIGSSRA